MKRFIVVSDELLDKIEQLSDGAGRFVFLLLRRSFYKNNLFRTCKTLHELAEIAGRSERTVRRYLEELQSVATISLSPTNGKYTLEFTSCAEKEEATPTPQPSTNTIHEVHLFDDIEIDDAAKLVLSAAATSVYTAFDDGKLKKEKVIEEVFKKAKADVKNRNDINAVLNACLALIETKRSKVTTPIAFIKAALHWNYQPRKPIEMNALTIIERNIQISGYTTVREMLCSIGFSRLLDCRYFLHRRDEGIKALA